MSDEQNSTKELIGRQYPFSPHIYVTGTRQVLRHVHDASMCEGDFCVIHGPSRHPLVNAPTHWRIGTKKSFDEITYWMHGEVMERICPHGIFHPDPDDLEFIRRSKGDEAAERIGMHECCGCCQQQGDAT